MYHSLLPLAENPNPNPNSSVEKPLEPRQLRGWLGPRASMGAIPAATRPRMSLFPSPQPGYYSSYTLPGPSRRESTCNFIDQNVIYGGRRKGGMTHLVVADILVPLYLTTITIQIHMAALCNMYNI